MLGLRRQRQAWQYHLRALRRAGACRRSDPQAAAGQYGAADARRGRQGWGPVDDAAAAQAALRGLGLGGLAAYLAYRAFAPDPLAWGAALLAFAAVAYGLKLLHSIVTRPLQWLMLVALVFGVDHFLFEGALSAWLVQSGPGVIKGLFSG